MSAIVANDVAVISGSVDMPLNGIWLADLVIDQADASGFANGTQVKIVVDNGFSLTGTVAPDRTGAFLDSVHVRVVGGKAGMGKTVQARGYAQPSAFVRDVLNGIAGDAGETLSSTIDAGFLGQNLTSWATMQCTAAQALNAFIEFVSPTANWRFLADGTLWVGVETYPTSNDVFDVLSSSPVEGTAELGVEAPSVMPGTTLDGVGKVNRVEHKFEQDEGIRSHVFVSLTGINRGATSAIDAIVAQQMMGVEYFGLFEGKVVSQSGDLSTVDVQMLPPVDKKVPSLQRVEVRAGTGIKVQFAPGAKVLLGWKGGDARYPYVVPGLGADGFVALTIGGATADNVATKTDLGVLMTAITNGVAVAQDGGVALAKSIVALLAKSGWVAAAGDGQMASGVVKVQR